MTAPRLFSFWQKADPDPENPVENPETWRRGRSESVTTATACTAARSRARESRHTSTYIYGSYDLDPDDKKQQQLAQLLLLHV
jgi:hypothetical protein